MDKYSEINSSYNRIEMLAHELRYYENALNTNILDSTIPFISDLYIEYVFELFNQNILFMETINTDFKKIKNK